MRFGSRLFETSGDKYSQVSNAQTCQTLWSCCGTLLLFLCGNILQSIITYFSNGQECVISVMKMWGDVFVLLSHACRERIGVIGTIVEITTSKWYGTL